MKSETTHATLVPVETCQGVFLARYSSKGLAGLEFPNVRSQNVPVASRPPQQIERWHAITVAALREALEGKTPRKLPPLDTSSGTAFQQQIWRVLCGIRVGETMTYSEVAKAVGKPGAARAA